MKAYVMLYALDHGINVRWGKEAEAQAKTQADCLLCDADSVARRDLREPPFHMSCCRACPIFVHDHTVCLTVGQPFHEYYKEQDRKVPRKDKVRERIVEMRAQLIRLRHHFFGDAVLTEQQKQDAAEILGACE